MKGGTVESGHHGMSRAQGALGLNTHGLLGLILVGLTPRLTLSRTYTFASLAPLLKFPQDFSAHPENTHRLILKTTYKSLLHGLPR